MQTDRPLPELSPREQQLLRLASEGMTDTAIANKLGISEATVGTYWGRVRIKLGPHSRTELVAIVLRAEREDALNQLKRENERLAEQVRAQNESGTALIYRDLLDQAPDATILVSETGMIEYANDAALALFEYAKDDLIGRDLRLLVPKRFREAHLAHRESYMRDPERRQMGQHLQTPAVKSDGTEFLIRAALAAIRTPTGLIVMCAIRPVE